MLILGYSQEHFKEEDTMQLASAVGSSSGAVAVGAVAVGQQDSGAVRQPASELGSGDVQVMKPYSYSGLSQRQLIALLTMCDLRSAGVNERFSCRR
jgi:hypothetical protein